MAATYDHRTWAAAVRLLRLLTGLDAFHSSYLVSFWKNRLSSIGLYGPISLPPDVVLRNGMVSAHWIIPVLRRS